MIKRLFWLTTLLVALFLLTVQGGVLAQPETAAQLVEETNSNPEVDLLVLVLVEGDGDLV